MPRCHHRLLPTFQSKDRPVTTRAVFAHVLRTILLVFVGAGVFLGIIVGGILLRAPVALIFGLLALAIFALIYGTARWHAYWAPICKRAAQFAWDRDDGMKMKTIVEIAIVRGGLHTRTGTYRVSIYELPGKRLRKRVMIGESVHFFRVFEPGIWFYIYDSFHARRDGLVCVDKKTGAWLYHEPQSVVQLVDDADHRSGVIEIVRNGVLEHFDLKKVSIPTSCPAWPQT